MGAEGLGVVVGVGGGGGGIKPQYLNEVFNNQSKNHYHISEVSNTLLMGIETLLLILL